MQEYWISFMNINLAKMAEFTVQAVRWSAQEISTEICCIVNRDEVILMCIVRHSSSCILLVPYNRKVQGTRLLLFFFIF
jgi:hypothetical protein